MEARPEKLFFSDTLPIQTNKLRSYGYKLIEKAFMDAQNFAQN